MLAATQDPHRPLIVTAIFTGLRASELRGLRWRDVDLAAELLTVRQRADRWNEIGAPKSEAGQREVPLAPIVVNTLKEWRLACPKGESDLVFPTSKGNVANITNLHRTVLGPLQLAAGITTVAKVRREQPGLSEQVAIRFARRHPKYGFHSLRHAAASLFIEEGWTAKKLQAVMGHGSIAMTYDTYGHLFPSPDDDRTASADCRPGFLDPHKPRYVSPAGSPVRRALFFSGLHGSQMILGEKIPAKAAETLDPTRTMIPPV